MKPLFYGSATALITPFTDTAIDFESYEKMIEFQIENGTDALVVLGTTGEPSTMTEAEKHEIIEFAIKKIAGRVPTIIGTGSNNTDYSIKLSIAAEKAGADGVLAVTPYYNKCTQNGLVEYYRAITEKIGIPLICYNVPARTGVNILPQTMAKIAELKNVDGIKEACGNMEQICETMRLIRGKSNLYSGDDNLNLPMLAIGAAGLISVASNIVPKEVKAVCEYVRQNRYDLANELTDRLLPVIDALFYEVNPIPAKAAAKLIGLCNGIVRAPLTELEPHNLERLKTALKNFGFAV